METKWPLMHGKLDRAITAAQSVYDVVTQLNQVLSAAHREGVVVHITDIATAEEVATDYGTREAAKTVIGMAVLITLPMPRPGIGGG